MTKILMLSMLLTFAGHVGADDAECFPLLSSIATLEEAQQRWLNGERVANDQTTKVIVYSREDSTGSIYLGYRNDVYSLREIETQTTKTEDGSGYLHLGTRGLTLIAPIWVKDGYTFFTTLNVGNNRDAKTWLQKYAPTRAPGYEIHLVCSPL